MSTWVSFSKWVWDLGLKERDLEDLTANDNADEDHSDVMGRIFLKYVTTPEAQAMLFCGARESLDMFKTFYDSLNHTIAKFQ